ncbi:hypothetical protein K438DRAFT_1581786, partial [Mycena galopus ATCC 62051]
DTLMQYLLDSFQSYESGHSDALNPFRTEPDKTFMGEHTLLQPATKAELQLFGEQILTKLDHVTNTPNVLPSNTLTAALAVLLSSLTGLSSDVPAGQRFFETSGTRSPAVTTVADPCAGNFLPSVAQDDKVMNMASDSSAAPNWTNSDAVPIANTIIPNAGRSNTAWKRAIDQWYHVDPAEEYER